MSDFETPAISKKINSDNYLINCYKHLTKIKEIHFLFILIEILLNISYQLETLLRGFQFNINNDYKGLYIVSFITNKCDQIPLLLKFIMVILLILIFDLLYIFIKIKKFNKEYISIKIFVFFSEIICFRPTILLFLNLFFTLQGYIFIIGCLLLIPHICIIMHNFVYNHL